MNIAIEEKQPFLVEVNLVWRHLPEPDLHLVSRVLCVMRLFVSSTPPSASMSPNGEKDRLRTSPQCCNSAMSVRQNLKRTPLHYKVTNESVTATTKYELEGEKHPSEFKLLSFKLGCVMTFHKTTRPSSRQETSHVQTCALRPSLSLAQHVKKFATCVAHDNHVVCR